MHTEATKSNRGGEPRAEIAAPHLPQPRSDPQKGHSHPESSRTSLAEERREGTGEPRAYLRGELRAEALAEEDGVAMHEEAEAAVDSVDH